VSKIRRAAATIDASLGRALAFLPPPVGTPRLCHGDLHPSNVILGSDGPMIVDWFDASRGDPIADVARSSVTLLGDGANPPEHLPGARRQRGCSTAVSGSPSTAAASLSSASSRR
jgi:aminoglycoside phosphotransferase (APT) family kinase protein